MASVGKVCQTKTGIPFTVLSMTKLNEFLRISEAAEYLGVSPNTLRNWENAGKIAAHRHPVNDYRLFKQSELDELLESAQQPTSTKHPKKKPN